MKRLAASRDGQHTEQGAKLRFRRIVVVLLVAAFAVLSEDALLAGQADGTIVLRGKVVGQTGQPVAGAVVKLHEPGAKDIMSETDALGGFELKTARQARYDVSAETVDHRHGELTVAQPGDGLYIVVRGAEDAHLAMDFADKPDFTVAGITDWTAVGGHGSDATLRTSEEMARKAAGLKSSMTGADVAGAGLRPLQRAGSQAAGAEAHRIAGERAETMGDPLAAAREEEQAAALDPSEENFFAWGSELLLHRAIWQAAEVYAKGARQHPESQRLRTGWGAALFAGAKYDEAAERLCEASDLDPANRETYLFLGKVGLGSPSPAVCVDEKLKRFVRMRPEDADANYYEAMMLLKGGIAGDHGRATELLHKTVALKPGFAEGYLQLGILALGQRDNAAAEAEFQRAIRADGSLAEAHYRLGVVYDKMGRSEEAKAEFARHEALVKEQAETVERERRQVKQFLVVLGDGKNADSLRE